MRRAAIVVCAGVALALAGQVFAKFGTFGKTKVVLPRVRPPAVPVIGETVAIDVRSDGPEFSGTHVRTVRTEIETALSSPGIYRLVEGRGADATVRVDLESLTAEIRDEVRRETRYVKVGTREEWNDKKKKYETKDVYKNREFLVSFRIVDGRASASLEVEGPNGARRSNADATYQHEFKEDTRVPPEASSEEALKRFLVQELATRAAGSVVFAPDAVEALLAVDGELKDGNRLAQAGSFQEALDAWSRLKLRGDKEAARLHNVGVAHEALAYALPPHTPEHRSHLEAARDHYRKARELDAGEKYFGPPLERIEASLGYAASAVTLAEDLGAFRQKKGRAADAGPRRKTTEPAPRKAAEPPASAPSRAAGPLRNGSFESSLSPWTLTGRGAVVDEPGRGRVLEVASSADAAKAQQAVAVDVAKARTALLSFDYKVTTGSSHLRVMLGYDDADGRPRVSSLEVAPNAAPGPWASWSHDVLDLKPRPSRLKEVRIVVEGGTVRIDNVALNVP